MDQECQAWGQHRALASLTGGLPTATGPRPLFKLGPGPSAPAWAVSCWRAAGRWLSSASGASCLGPQDVSSVCGLSLGPWLELASAPALALCCEMPFWPGLPQHHEAGPVWPRLVVGHGLHVWQGVVGQALTTHGAPFCLMVWRWELLCKHRLHPRNAGLRRGCSFII